MLVRAVDRWSARTEDHRRDSRAEAGGVAEPALADETGLAAANLAHRLHHQADDLVFGASQVSLLDVGQGHLGDETVVGLTGDLEAAIDLRAHLVHADARLWTGVDADHALVGDHRRAARREPTVD